MTKSQLVEMFRKFRGASPCTITAITEVKLPKTVRRCLKCKSAYGAKGTHCLACGAVEALVEKVPLDGIMKESRVNAMIGSIYTNAVQNRRMHEHGEDVEMFEAEPRKWGERVEGTPLVKHFKDNAVRWYLEVQVRKSLEHSYYRADGRPIAASEVEKWIPNRVEGARQEVDEPVIWRDYSVDSLVSLRLAGQEIRMEDDNANRSSEGA